MSMQLAHQLGAAKLLNPAAADENRTDEAGPPAWLPARSKRAEMVIPRNAVLWRPRRRPKRATALSESQPPSNAISVIEMNGVVPQNAPLVMVRPRTRVR